MRSTSGLVTSSPYRCQLLLAALQISFRRRAGNTARASPDGGVQTGSGNLKTSILVFGLILCSVCRVAASASISTESQRPASASPAQEGEALARRYCQSCHLFVEPSLLPQHVWRDTIIPRMGARLGMHHAGYDYTSKVYLGASRRERAILQQAAVFPNAPLVPTPQWEQIIHYYVSQAPQRLEPNAPLPEIEPDLRLLRAKPWPFSHATPTTTFIEIDETRHEILVADMLRQSISVLSAKGELKQEIQVGAVPVAVHKENDELWITTIGSVAPSDVATGSVIKYEKVGQRYRFFPGNRVLENLIRPTDATYVDLNGDGIKDIVVSEFGHYLGRFAWHQGSSDGRYTRHDLLHEPGSMFSYVHDFNGDRLPDLAVVVGQNREGVHIFTNTGNGTFTSDHAVAVPPVYGSSNLSLHDFNNDGHMDLLVTSGDNGDYEAILKPYHGVRIYLNDRSNGFVEAYFFPQNGAYKAIAEDFDKDGDLDIVSVSMFADYTHRPSEGFVYLENQGALKFKAYSIPQVDQGRWMTMDTGDVDGDGDTDVVLGSFVTALTPTPDSFATRWKSSTMRVLFLENQLK